MCEDRYRETDLLLAAYLNVANTALTKHRKEPPFREMIEAADEPSTPKDFGVAVYDGDDDDEGDLFTLRFERGYLLLVDRNHPPPEVEWETRRRDLEEVVQNPEAFIEQPGKLELDWLKERFDLVS